MYRYAFFDLDGTLTDSSEGIINSIKYALEKNGYPVPDETELLKFIGPPLGRFLCRLSQSSKRSGPGHG